MGLFKTLLQKKSYQEKASLYNSHYKLYKYDTLEHIEAIPVPTKSFTINFDFKESVEYVLQRKATEHKRNGNIDLAIACLKKSNEIMPYSEMLYTSDDYLRLVKYLKLANRFDEARNEEEKIIEYLNKTGSIQKDQILNRAKEASRLYDNDGYILVSRGHCICAECARYHDRLYSANGIDNRVPNFESYETYINQKTCSCQLITFPFCLGINIMRGLGEENPIEYSSRPFTDDRTDSEKESYDAYIAKQESEKKNRQDYDWICENLSDIAPKSLSGFTKMKNSNSSNFQKIVQAAQEKGYNI